MFERYNNSELEKDYKAWKRAELHIKDIIDDEFYTYIIEDMDYSLEDIIH